MHTRSYMRTAATVIGVSAAALLSTQALATTSTGTMAVSATVSASCSISPNALSFGTYSGSQDRQTTTISVTCTNTTPYNIGLSAGATSGATVTNRMMSDGNGHTLNYALYQDSGYSTNWGQTVGTDTEAGTGTGSAQSLTVYGQIAAGQNPVPAAYTDSITATVTY